MKGFEVRFWWMNLSLSEFASSSCRIRSSSKFIIFGFDPTLICTSLKTAANKVTIERISQYLSVILLMRLSTH